MKVMVVEDGTMVRRLLCEYLKRLNVDDVVECESGVQALDYISNNSGERLSAIFLDINMNGMNGLEFLKEFTFKSIYQDIPIFVITGDACKEKLKTCFRYEIYSYIEKPFDYKQIQDCVSIARRIECADDTLAETCY
ncbi:MAG: response regulator [Lentisphaeraceae bacterium]|nr:response regulator [Lentisphaeraceae bacterium]